MANTERLKVIQMLRDARKAVGKARRKKDLRPEQRANLDKLYSILDRLEGKLIFQKIKSIVSKIDKDAGAIQGLANKIEKSMAELKKVAKKVKKAAKAVKILAKITSLPASAGLV